MINGRARVQVDARIIQASELDEGALRRAYSSSIIGIDGLDEITLPYPDPED